MRFIVASAIGAALALPSAAGSQAPKERFTGFAINMNAGPNTAMVDFEVERWSTDEERAQLLTILVEEKNPYQANEKMLKTLEKMPKTGFIRTQRTLAWDLKYARQTPLPDGGRRLVLATDRPIGFREAVVQGRTMDYPFTIVEIRLDKKDEGEGKILAGTRLLIDKDKNLVLENYGQQPVRFNQIRKLK
jgi:hypothetical protein